MIFNEQQTTYKAVPIYLLEWVNVQKNATDKHGYVFSFSSMLQDSTIYDILSTVNSCAFYKLQFLNAQEKMDIIEKYLQSEFGKRLKWAYKQILGQFKQLSEIVEFIKLVCYFSIHSKNKNDVINRILTLSQQSQKMLMQDMQKMQQKMENIIQIKEIIEQLQLLQSQNQQLRQQITQMNKTNAELLKLISQYQVENDNIKKQNQKHRKQKCQVFSHLDIKYIAEYIQVYRSIRYQNQKIGLQLRQCQNKLQICESNNKELNQRIKCDCIVINNLSQEINKLKQIYNEKIYCSNRTSFDSVRSLNVLQSFENKQNISKCSTYNSRQSDGHSDWLGFTEPDEETGQKCLIRTHNKDLMNKLQSMYGKFNEINTQTNELKQNNRFLIKNNRSLLRTLREVEYTHKQFQFKYRAASIQTKLQLNKINKISAE